jgi:hypothetical protein
MLLPLLGLSKPHTGISDFVHIDHSHRSVHLILKRTRANLLTFSCPYDLFIVQL